MASHQELIQARLASGKIYAEDIKHQGRLNEEQIRGISTTLAYTWIKAGQWKKKDFEKWLSVRMNKQGGQSSSIDATSEMG